MKTKGSLFWIAATLIVAGAAIAFVFRTELQRQLDAFLDRTTPAGDSAGPSPQGDPSSPVTHINATASGYEPARLTLAEGEHILEFTRTVENTCANAVKFSATGEEFELPVGSPVRIPVTVHAGQTIAYACPMDMYRGEVVGTVDGASATDSDAHDPSAIAYWTCSMHPSVQSSEPGTCPICSMDLISVTWGELETGVIIVDAQRRQLIGVKTDFAAVRPIGSEVRAAGRIAYDETRVADVTLRLDAWIGTLNADFTGMRVEKGEALATFYNPELWSLQREYLDAIARAQGDNASAKGLVSAAEARLKVWGIEDAQLTAIRERGAAIEYLTVHAPISGTIIEKHVVEGSAVEAGAPLYRIADLSVVWIEADVFEDDIARIQPGQRARFAVQGLPDQAFEATVSYLYPYVDPVTRTGRVRFEAANPDGLLRPDLYVSAVVEIPLSERLVVPVGAVIFAGASHVVFVDLGEGRLEPRRVKIGAQTPDYVEILEGVAEGEEVVTSANFLIAAESKLKSGLEKW